MRTKLKFLVPVLLLGLLATSCSNGGGIPVNVDLDDVDIDTPWEDYNVPLENLKFQDEDYNLVLEVGQKHNYSYTYSPKQGTPSGLQWSNSDPEVVKFEKNGDKFSIEALKTGKATLTVDGGEGSGFDPIELNVRVDVLLSSFTLDSANLDLDLGETHQLVPSFEPLNTTQKELRYTIKEGADIISVDDFGKVSAKTAGTAKIEVVSDLHEDKKQEVNVVVSDKYTYLETFTVEVDKSRAEVGKTAQLSVNMLPANHTASLDDVRYVSLTPDVLEVNEKTGEVKVLSVNEEKKGSVKAIVNQRNGDKETEPIEIEVYEVKISSISLGADSGQTIALGNKGVISHQLSYTYEVDEVGATEPSYKDIIFNSSDDKVVKVNQEGLVEIVGPGTAEVTVMDDHSGEKDSCNFEVTYLTEAISIVTDKSSVLTGENFTVTATTNPATLSHELEWNIENVDDFEVAENGNKVKLSTLVPGEYDITATCDGIVSNTITVTVNKRPGIFEAGKYYIVGTADYASGESVSGSSWDDSDKAFLLEEFERHDAETGEIFYEEFGRLSLKAGDEFKVRCGDKYYENIIDEVKHYDEIDAIPDYITVGGEYNNFTVLQSGTYDLYFKLYRRGEETEWHQMYIGFAPVFNVSTTELSVDLGKESEFKISNWEEPLTVKAADETIISVDVDANGLATVIGLLEGNTTISVKDNSGTEFIINVNVIHIDYRTIYIQASDMFDQANASMWAHAWDDNGAADYKFAPLIGEPGMYSVDINKAYEFIIFTRNEPSATGPWNKTWNQTGTMALVDFMNMWTMEGYDNGVPYGEWSLYDDSPKVMEVNPTELHLGVGGEATITTKYQAGTVTFTSNNTSVVQVNASGEVIAIAAGETTISVSDGVTNVNVNVTVTEVAPHFKANTYYLVGNRDYSTGTSKAGESWGDVTKALPITSDIGPNEELGVAHQYKATVKLSKGDLFKFRLGEDYLNSIYAEQTEAIPSKIDRGASSYEDNFVVEESGKYEILLKCGTDGGYSVYIKEAPTMSVDKNHLNLIIDGVEAITVDNVEGELKVESKDTDVATISKNGTVITVTAVGIGSTTIEFKDDNKTINVPVNVTATEPKHVTIYFAGLESFGDLSAVNIALDGEWQVATKTTGTDAENGQYKAVFNAESGTSVNAYLEEGSKFFHPTSGTIDWDTNYSSINLESVTIEGDNSYVITYTSWHYNYDNWTNAWFNYTFAKLS